MLGTDEDKYAREIEACVDDEACRKAVDIARDNIYQKGYVVDSPDYVERYLKEDSLVPTKVSCQSYGA